MKKKIIEAFCLIVLAFLGYIWWGSPNKELVWYLLPVCGLFRMVGGTWSHTVGRFFYTAALVMAAYFFIGLSWIWLPLMALGYFAAKTLPFTLIGDSLHDNWFNWIWIWILGFITALPVLFAGIWTHQIGLSLLICVIPAMVFGVMGTASNLEGSAKYFVWKLCEFCFGAVVALPLCMIIQLA